MSVGQVTIDGRALEAARAGDVGKLRELKQSGVDLSGTDEVRVRGARCEEVEWGHSAMQYLTWRGVLRCVLTCGDVRWCSVCMCVHLPSV